MPCPLSRAASAASSPRPSRQPTARYRQHRWCGNRCLAPKFRIELVQRRPSPYLVERIEGAEVRGGEPLIAGEVTEQLLVPHESQRVGELAGCPRHQILLQSVDDLDRLPRFVSAFGVPCPARDDGSRPGYFATCR